MCRSERSISGRPRVRGLGRADDGDRPRREQRPQIASQLIASSPRNLASRQAIAALSPCSWVIRRNSSRAGRFAVSIITSSSMLAAIAARNPATSHARFTARFVVCTTNGSFFAISFGERERGVVEVVARHHAVHQAEAQRLLGRDAVLAGEQQLLGRAHAHDPRQEHRDHARAEPDVDVAEFASSAAPRGRTRASGRCPPPGSTSGPGRSSAWDSPGTRASGRWSARGPRASARASSSPPVGVLVEVVAGAERSPRARAGSRRARRRPRPPRRSRPRARRSARRSARSARPAGSSSAGARGRGPRSAATGSAAALLAHGYPSSSGSTAAGRGQHASQRSARATVSERGEHLLAARRPLRQRALHRAVVRGPGRVLARERHATERPCEHVHPAPTTALSQASRRPG